MTSSGLDAPLVLGPPWRVLLHDVGLAPGPVLREAALPPWTFDGGSMAVTPGEFLRFWRALERSVEQPRSLPLRLGEALTPESLPIPMLSALTSPSLAAGLERLELGPRAFPLGLRSSTDDGGLLVHLGYAASTSTVPRLMETLLVFVVRLARLALRDAVLPLEVTMPLPPQPEEAWMACLGRRVQPDEAWTVRFAAEDAERTFVTANPTLSELVARAARLAALPAPVRLGYC